MHPVDFFFEIWPQVPEVARSPLQTILTHPYPPSTIGSVCETLRAAGRALGNDSLESAADTIHKIACDRGLPWGFNPPDLGITELLCEEGTGTPMWLAGLQAQTQRLHSRKEALRAAARAYTEEIGDLRDRILDMEKREARRRREGKRREDDARRSYRDSL